MPKIAATMKDFQEKVDQQMMVIACKIIYENYGKLKNKGTRIQTFIDLYNEEMRQWRKLSGEKLVWDWDRKDEKDGLQEFCGA